MKSEVIVLNEKRNVTLTAYIQPVGGKFINIIKRPALIVLPGGGYKYCSDREADPVAFEYLKAGYQVFILRYSVKENALWPNPLSDYEKAMELIRDNSNEWNIYEDKIGVIGFSAGGHLAAAAATLSKNRPNAAILGYALTIGKSAKEWEKTAPDVVSAVDKDTCPCFLFATRTDDVVPIENSIKFMNALDENGISFESHIYSFGPHGFSTCDSSVMKQGVEITNRAKNWVNDSIEWLKEVFGDFGEGKMTEAKYSNRINGNSNDYLSIDCTVDYLMSNGKSQKYLLSLFRELMEKPEVKEELKTDEGKLFESLALKMKLKDVLEHFNVNKDKEIEINNYLNKIYNK